MLAVQGIYDGASIRAKEAIPFDEEYDVVITFLKPRKFTNSKEKDDIDERLSMAESLFGILPPTITEKEIKETRYERYERSYR